MARGSLAARLDPQRFPAHPQREPGDVNELLHAVEHYHLDDHDAGIGHLARSLQFADVSPLRQQLATSLRARVQPFLAYHREHPFVTASPSALTGPITLGTQAANHDRIGLSLDDINLHGTIVGPSGSGKTTILRHLADGLLQQGIRLGVIDTKEDFGWLLKREDVLLIDEHTPWNFLTTPTFLTPAAHRDEVIDLLLTRFYGGAAQRAILEEGWHRAEKLRPDFSLAEWITSIDSEASPKERFARADARHGSIARLRRFAQHALFTTREGIPWNTLLAHTFVVRSRGFDDVARFQFDLLARYAFLNNRSRHQTGLQLVLLVDESYDLMSVQQDGIRAIETLPRLKQLGREFGIGTITTTVTLNGLSELARASTHWHVALPPNNHDEARAVIRVFGLNDTEADYFLRRLVRGDALLRIGTWPEVVHLNIPSNTTTKHATEDDITAARARASRLARSMPRSPAPFSASTGADTATKTIETAAHATPSYATASAAPRAASEHEHQGTPPSTRRRVALNKHTAALMEDVADHPLTLTTPSFRRCNLRLSEGDRAKTLAINLGFLESHRVRTGAGRGKTGSALRLTPAGWAWLDRKPPKGTRGGDSVQHEFLIRHLAAAMPRSTIETLGADIVVAYNTAEQEQLLHALHTISKRTIALNDGDLIAIEVECSRPEKTAPRNIARNNGFALTVIAVLGATPARQQTLHGDHVIVIDVLCLLDALRPTEKG